MSEQMETVEAPWPETVCCLNGWVAVNGTCPEHQGDACLVVLPGYLDYLKAQRDTAVQVGATSFRHALTTRATKGPSLAEIASVEVTDNTPNWRIQDGIAEEMDRWLVPVAFRPKCPIDQKACPNWTCLLDVCVDAKRARG